MPTKKVNLRDVCASPEQAEEMAARYRKAGFEVTVTEVTRPFRLPGTSEKAWVVERKAEVQKPEPDEEE